MGVQNVNNSSNTYNAYAANQTTAAKKDDAVQENEEVKNESVKNNISDSTEKTKTNKYQPDSATLNEIYSAQKNYLRNLQNMVNQLLEQAGSNRIATFGDEGGVNMAFDVNTAAKYSQLLVKNGDGTYSFDPSLSSSEVNSLRSKAVEDISEDGYFGVKQTSERILSFAKALTGGDPSRVEEMRKYIDKAFGDVRKMFGGKLPDISEKTYGAIMKGLDEWAAEGSVSAG